MKKSEKFPEHKLSLKIPYHCQKSKKINGLVQIGPKFYNNNALFQVFPYVEMASWMYANLKKAIKAMLKVKSYLL